MRIVIRPGSIHIRKKRPLCRGYFFIKIKKFLKTFFDKAVKPDMTGIVEHKKKIKNTRKYLTIVQ